jgi:tight adherence protein C
MNEWIILGAAFLLVFAATFFVVRALTGGGRKDETRLAGAGEESPNEDQPLVLGDLTQPLGQWSQASDAKKKAELEQELREAGYYRPTALLEYSAVRTLLVAVPIVVAVVLVVTLDHELAPWIIGAGVIFALLGYAAPRTYVNYRARQRGREIERGLPVAVDLLSLCLTGGQNFLTALERVAADLEFSFPIMAQELRIVHRHAQMAGLDLALQNFANRTNVPEVKSLAIMLAHVDRLGTDVATALLEFSTSFRQTIRLRAETYANRVSFWVLFPTILCLLVPGVLLFYAPLMFEISRLQQERREDFQKTQKSLQKLERPKPRITTESPP